MIADLHDDDDDDDLISSCLVKYTFKFEFLILVKDPHECGSCGSFLNPKNSLIWHHAF